MNIPIILISLSPILLILILLLWKRLAADSAGLIGWLFISLIAFLFFETPPSIIFKSSLAGILASLPITLMVATSILQITIMLETGAIDRIVTLIKTIAPKDQVIQIMIINLGFGTFLAALGATPVSILPPIMLALGYSSIVAIALPSIGYDALCTYALLGVPVVVFANIIGKSVVDVGFYFSRFMPFISTSIAFGMLYIVGRWKLIRKGFFPAIIAGGTAGYVAIFMNKLGLVTLTGVAAGLGVILIMFVYMVAMRKKVIDTSILSNEDRLTMDEFSIWRALSPWLFLIGFAIIINLPSLPFYEWTFTKLSMPIEIIPGNPEKLRTFWQAYFWILISTICSFPFLKPNKNQLAISFKKWLKRAPRPMLTSAVFFMIAFIYNQSGKNLNWELIDASSNMISVLANGSANLFGRFYPMISPFLGMLAGFISGSETSAIAMLTNLHISTATKIGISGFVVAAASGIGAGLASVISPAKLQNAAASIDRIGEESSVLRLTIGISVVITAICAVLSLIWSI